MAKWISFLLLVAPFKTQNRIFPFYDSQAFLDSQQPNYISQQFSLELRGEALLSSSWLASFFLLFIFLFLLWHTLFGGPSPLRRFQALFGGSMPSSEVSTKETDKYFSTTPSQTKPKQNERFSGGHPCDDDSAEWSLPSSTGTGLSYRPEQRQQRVCRHLSRQKLVPT